MTRPIPSSVPAQLTAGDTWSLDLTFADYPPSDGWTVALLFRGRNDLSSEAAEIAVAGSTYEVRIPATRTALLTAGSYRYYVTASRTVEAVVERVTIARGAVRVRANPATAVNALTHAERTYDIIVLALEGRLTADVEGYTIEGRAVTKIPIQQLEKMRGRYARRIRAMRSRGQLGRTVGVTFAAPR